MSTNGRIFQSVPIFGSSELSGLAITHPKNQPPKRIAIPSNKRRHEFGRSAIAHLFNTPADQIHKYELAEMNLVCAFGLPGAMDLDIAAMLTLLDTWVKGASDHVVKSARHFYKFRSKSGWSLARYRMAMVVEFLARECGVTYNPERVVDPDNFEDPADSFIHGLLGPRRMGTCATLPVLLTAIGRKLGYPLKLVFAPRHCFCRWDTPEERFNIEWHSDGLNTHPDEFYKEWPLKWTPQMHEHEQKRPTYLVSATPQWELGFSAQNRAAQLDVAGRRDEAYNAMQIAYQLWPNHGYAVWTTHLLTKKLYPEKSWPRRPCEETAGRTAYERLKREKGVIEVDPLDPRAPRRVSQKV